MRWNMFILCALVALPAVSKAAGDEEFDRATLRGLKAVSVVIDRVDPELPKEGVAPAALQDRIEGRLRDAKIDVNPSATEFIGLQISVVRGGRGPYALSMTIALYQPVVLVRDKNIKTTTKTWEVETILKAEPKILRQASMESVDELAARFVAAFQSVNPGK